jgi:DNA damage-binding protein 1
MGGSVGILEIFSFHSFRSWTVLNGEGYFPAEASEAVVFLRLWQWVFPCLSEGVLLTVMALPLILLQYDDGSGMKREATADDLIKVVEELTRIH